METDEDTDLQKIRNIADYQFGSEVGLSLFPEKVQIIRSRGTGRIRRVLLNGDLLATLRPTDGLFSLSIEGAKRLSTVPNLVGSRIVVMDSVDDFVRSGKTVFAKHVLHASEEIRPKDEVIVLNSKGEVLACGRALLNGGEMLRFKSGVAVNVRAGNRSGERFKQKKSS